jgi:DNA-binding winged helix-turn-helix (wHTH) protein
VSAPVRFRFAEFVLSPRQRLLVKNGSPVPLIPKYFDLLQLLVAHRPDAVSRQAIFDEIWSDVLVSDGALSQAVRTLRRTLGDDSREPRFIRTVSRHGYQFVWAEVVEEADDGRIETGPGEPHDSARIVRSPGIPESVEPLVEQLIVAAHAGRDTEADARELAERLHALGTADAVARLAQRPDHAVAVAVMRDARWAVPGAGHVPLLTDPRAAFALIWLRLRGARRLLARRLERAAAAGALGGAAAGFLGGIGLYLSPTSTARAESALALALIGALAGGFGAAGVGTGIATAEVLARSRRGLAVVASGAAAGAVVGSAAGVLLRSLLEGLIGLTAPAMGGTLEGMAIGAAAGVGYAWATRQPPGGGLAAPSGAKRVRAALIVACSCAAAAVALAWSGRPLVGGLIHELARQSQDARLVLAPLGRLIGEPGFGPITRTLLSALEGATFGGSLAWGLTHKPAAHDPSP